MLGRDESVARQQYRLQRLATKAQAILASRTSQRLWLASVKSVSAKQCKIYEHLELVPHLQVGHCHQHCHQGFRQAQYILHWKQSLMQQTRLRGVCSQAKLVMPKNTNKTDRVYWIMMRIHMLSQHHKGLQQKLPVCKTPLTSFVDLCEGAGKLGMHKTQQQALKLKTNLRSCICCCVTMHSKYAGRFTANLKPQRLICSTCSQKQGQQVCDNAFKICCDINS